ncbi:MAG TPA: 4Fe-4S dicluster domain-containing protein [Planctomycetota bacterium]|nr:4Fe-4S dicluster domain-containing protein [Planctomycetota bacterium]
MITKNPFDPGQVKSTLIDITNCIGCRACQVACKEWNERDGVQTELLPDLGYQNPAALSAKTLTLISFHETVDEKLPNGFRNDFVMRRCLHCLEPACVSACPTTALERRLDGPTLFDPSQCIGCRYCVWACPWDVPTADWDSLTPQIHKCTHCADRYDQPPPQSRNKQPLTVDETKSFVDNILTPACVKACPADALKFGTREQMLAEAHRRIGHRPGRYVDHIYGEKEAGGTSVLYLSAVPFEKLGFPKVSDKPYPSYTRLAIKAVAPAVIALGALLGFSSAFFERRRKRMQAEAPGTRAPDQPVGFEPVPGKLMTPFNWLLLALMGVGALAFLTRFLRGIGPATNLSDTWPWGLWIVLDIVWSAMAAGAFAGAALIYVFQRKDLYGMGRGAVFMGLLSYTFVTVTLIADLGRPWNVYNLLTQAPDQSAMFVVSWCVTMYVTMLLFEFMPVLCEQRGWTRAMELWRRWSGIYVTFAVTAFVWLLSRSYVLAAVAAGVFGSIAWQFRGRRGKFEPVLLAIAAGTLATMQHSTLGSLFLLMPDAVAPQWWSPVMPVSFFLSSIPAGMALIVLAVMWVSKGWGRKLRMVPLASLGQIAFWTLLVYHGFRLGDLALRGGFDGAFAGPYGSLFAVELVLGGLVPLVLLGRAAWRSRPGMLCTAALLTLGGVILNRVNVVIFAMQPKGPMPWTAPSGYTPSLVEWGLSLGLLAATVFLFGAGVRYLPVLPKYDEGSAPVRS